MASRLAQQLPSLFGPSRRAAWRLSLIRRLLAAGALLLALHLGLGSVRPAPEEAPAAKRPSGPALSLPLALPADHLSPGDAVGVYLPGRTEPVLTGARVLSLPDSQDRPAVVRVSVGTRDVGPLLKEIGPERAGEEGFVVVGEG